MVPYNKELLLLNTLVHLYHEIDKTEQRGQQKQMLMPKAKVETEWQFYDHDYYIVTISMKNIFGRKCCIIIVICLFLILLWQVWDKNSALIKFKDFNVLYE